MSYGVSSPWCPLTHLYLTEWPNLVDFTADVIVGDKELGGADVGVVIGVGEDALVVAVDDDSNCGHGWFIQCSVEEEEIN